MCVVRPLVHDVCRVCAQFDFHLTSSFVICLNAATQKASGAQIVRNLNRLSKMVFRTPLPPVFIAQAIMLSPPLRLPPAASGCLPLPKRPIYFVNWNFSVIGLTSAPVANDIACNATNGIFRKPKIKTNSHINFRQILISFPPPPPHPVADHCQCGHTGATRKRETNTRKT